MASPPAPSLLPAHAPPPAPVAAPAATPVAAAAPPGKKQRGSGKRLTDRERLAILEELEKGAGVSNAAIARRYGVTRAAVQKLKAKGAEVRARYRHGSIGLRDERRRGSHSVSVPFERELFEWVRGLKARKVPVPPSLVKEKAKLLVPKYGLGSFQASNGWYYNFCRRFSLSSGALVEDKGDAPPPPPPPSSLRPPPPLDDGQSMVAFLPPPADARQADEFPADRGAADALPAVAYPADALPAGESAADALPAGGGAASKSDRILQLLERQAALIERQTRVSEQQSETMQRLLAFLVAGHAGGPSAAI